VTDEDESPEFRVANQEGYVVVAPEEPKKLPYLNMDNRIYYGATIALYIFEVLGAIVISDVGVIFEFVSAIAVSAIAFTLPGVFYLKAEKKFASEEYKLMHKNRRCGAYTFIVLGILVLIFCLSKSIMDAVDPSSSSE